MIKIIDLTGEFIKDKISFEAKKGSKSVFVFEKREGGEEFLRILTGLKEPKGGEIFLMGQNLKKLTRDKLFEFRKKIAIAFKAGGLINNLRVWENLMLPAIYHKVSDKDSIKKVALKLLEEFEFKKDAMGKINELTNLEKRIIGIVRGFLMKPEIIIFEYPFDGISQHEKEWLAEKIEKLSKNLTSIFILSSESETYLLDKKGA